MSQNHHPLNDELIAVLLHKVLVEESESVLGICLYAGASAEEDVISNALNFGGLGASAGVGVGVRVLDVVERL